MVEITEPFHGAVLNHSSGRQTDESLLIEVRGLADAGVEVAVNGAAARRSGRQFVAEIALRDRETEIVAVAANARPWGVNRKTRPSASRPAGSGTAGSTVTTATSVVAARAPGGTARLAP